MAKLGATADANTPVLQNLNAASGQLNRLLTDLPPFSRSAIPAHQVARSGVGDRQGGGQGRGPDGRRPQPVRQADARAGPEPGHRRCTTSTTAAAPSSPTRAAPAARDTPGSRRCSSTCSTRRWRSTLRPVRAHAGRRRVRQPDVHPVRDAGHDRHEPASSTGPSYRQCYSWLGPNQPGVNEPDPSNPSALRPRPGRRASRSAGADHHGVPLSASADAANAARASSRAAARHVGVKVRPLLRQRRSTGRARVLERRRPARVRGSAVVRRSPAGARAVRSGLGGGLSRARSGRSARRVPARPDARRRRRRRIQRSGGSSGGRAARPRHLLNYLLAP